MKILSVFTLLFLLSGCGKIQPGSQVSSSENKTDCTNCSVVHLAVDLNSSTEVLNQTKTLQNYRSCLGLEQISAETKAQYNSIKGSLSYTGKSKSINNTVTFANIKAAVVACHAFIKQEEDSEKRKIFRNFSLTEDDQYRISNMSPAIKKIAQNCWGRQISDLELDLIKSRVQGLFQDNPTSKASALFICTAMLSTPEAMKQ